MHASSMENMQRCLAWYLPATAYSVVDLGAMDVNGSYRSLVPPGCDYVGVDLEAGPGVDVVLEDVYRLPFADGSIDLVLSGQMLEHCGHFWRVFGEIARILRPGGMAFLIAPSAGPVHRYPVDCYRFYPDSFQALADWCGLRLVHSWTDERGPWRDIVGVFQKGGSIERLEGPPVPAAVPANAATQPHADPAAERLAGRRPYLDVLRDLHSIVQPRSYLEIGVRRGRSLALAQCPAIAIDPDPHPDFRPERDGLVFSRSTSDDHFFFATEAPAAPIDLAFIDGMHLAEFVLRDFMNVERLMSAKGVIVIDDVLPNHSLQARRTRQTQAWTGDVWRFVAALQERRPDLRLTWLDTAPTGLLLVSRLNPKNRALWDAYNKVARRLEDTTHAPVPEALLTRADAVDPTPDALRAAIGR